MFVSLDSDSIKFN